MSRDYQPGMRVVGKEGPNRPEEPEAEHSSVLGELPRAEIGREGSPRPHPAWWVLQGVLSNFFFLVRLLGDRVSQYSPDLPGILCVAQACRELIILLPQQPPDFKYYLCASTPS